MRLLAFTFHIYHVKGKELISPDILPRNPLDDPGDKDDMNEIDVSEQIFSINLTGKRLNALRKA